MTTLDYFDDYPEFVPDLENYVSPNCVYLNADDLSPLICSLSLSILMLNIRSCKKNFDSFIANFYNCINSFSCMIFTETWLSEDRIKCIISQVFIAVIYIETIMEVGSNCI